MPCLVSCSHILLGSRGVDLPKLTQKLETLSASQSFEPINPIGDTDVEGYLKNERENAIIAVIEETNKNVSVNALFSSRIPLIVYIPQ